MEPVFLLKAEPQLNIFMDLLGGGEMPPPLPLGYTHGGSGVSQSISQKLLWAPCQQIGQGREGGTWVVLPTNEWEGGQAKIFSPCATPKPGLRPEPHASPQDPSSPVPPGLALLGWLRS